MASRFGSRLPLMLIAVTLVACLAALWWRVPLLSLHWARQLARTESSAQRARFLAALCNAGPDAAWGVARLVGDPRSDVRQCAAIALQRIRTDWGRAQLLRLLRDPDPDVRAMAALGLTVQRNDAIIPALTAMFEHGGADEADAAAAALARFGTPAATDALLALASRAVSAAQRAALIDSIDELCEPRGVPALLAMLDDARPCAAQRRAERQAWRAVEFGAAAAAGAGVVASAPAAPADQTTIAARAAEALGRITGIPAAPQSEPAAIAGEELRSRWRAWFAQREAAGAASRPALAPAP